MYIEVNPLGSKPPIKTEEYIKIRECLNCGGDVLAKKLGVPVQDSPSIEVKEYHKSNCSSLPVFIKNDYED